MKILVRVLHVVIIRYYFKIKRVREKMKSKKVGLRSDIHHSSQPNLLFHTDLNCWGGQLVYSSFLSNNIGEKHLKY